MAGLILFFLLLFGLIAALMLVRIKFDVRYSRNHADDLLLVEMSAFRGILKYKAEVPVIEIDRRFLEPILKVKAEREGTAAHPIEDKGMTVKIPMVTHLLKNLPSFIRQGLDFLKKYRGILRGLLRSTRCHHLSWTTRIGLADPANTGIAAGVLWGSKGMLYRVFRSKIGVMKNPPAFQVTPCFTGPCLSLDFHCIFDLRIGHIILAGLKFAKKGLSIIRTVRGTRNGRASD